MSLPAGSVHPDFERAPAHQQYRESVDRLWTALNTAARAGDGSWVRVVLPDGLQVALRILPNGARQVAIGRDDRTVDPAAWMAEVAAYRRRFGADNWQREMGETKAGGPRIVLTETIIEQDFFGSEEEDHGV